MLEHLGEVEAAERVMKAIEQVTANPSLHTRDLGGTATTAQVTQAVCRAVGAALGPLVGGLLVDTTGWQGLFWIDAGIAAVCIPVTLRGVQESRDPQRSSSIDWAGTALVAVALAPIILALSKGTDWGWTSASVPALIFLTAIRSAIRCTHSPPPSIFSCHFIRARFTRPWSSNALGS